MQRPRKTRLGRHLQGASCVTHTRGAKAGQAPEERQLIESHVLYGS